MPGLDSRRAFARVLWLTHFCCTINLATAVCTRIGVPTPLAPHSPIWLPFAIRWVRLALFMRSVVGLKPLPMACRCFKEYFAQLLPGNQQTLLSLSLPTCRPPSLSLSLSKIPLQRTSRTNEQRLKTSNK